MGFELPCPDATACASATPQNLISGYEPGEFIVKFEEVGTTDAWPNFETEYSSLNFCDSTNDCSSDVLYDIEVYACNTCEDSLACDNSISGETCEDW